MGDLEKFIPQESPTVTAIFDWHKKNGDAEERRTYLGASILGTECERALWYAFRWCADSKFDGRLYRLFETGHLEEPRIVRDLKAVGCTVHEVDPETGEQFEVSGVGGHFKGHADGVALGIIEAPETWHLLEFKTASEKQWVKIKAEGVKKAKISHYVQMMVYMGKMGLKRALYVVKNKNTDDLYAERIKYNAEEFKQYMDKAERIITAQMPPERISPRPDLFACRFCDAHELCWNTSKKAAVPLACVSCRSCCHATPEMDGDGRWSCNVYEKDLSKADQEDACEKHLLIPGLVGFADPVDAGDDWIEFENTLDKTRWRHGVNESDWTSEELCSGMGPLSGEVKAVSEAFGKAPVGIFERYPFADCRVAWDGANDSVSVDAGMRKVVGDGYGFGGREHGSDNEKSWEEFFGKWLLVRYPVAGVAVIFESPE